MRTRSLSHPFYVAGCSAASLVLLGTQASGQAFTYTPATSLEINFDDAPAGGATTNINGGFSNEWYDTFAGEQAAWGSFGGGPDNIEVSVLPDLGFNGAGDGIARMTVTDATPGGYFANLSFNVKGLRLLGNGTLDPRGNENADLGTFYSARIKTDVANANHRINIDTGFGTAGQWVDGVDPFAPAASRVINIGSDVPSLPVDTWTFVGGSLDTFTPATFNPFFSREINADQLTRIGVTYPGGGPQGQLDIDLLRLINTDVNNPTFLVYNPVDFNTDESVDAADIDDAFAALAAHNTNGNTFGTAADTRYFQFYEAKYDVTNTNAQSASGIAFDMDDIDYLVQTVLNTDYGDVDLDGVIDNTDLGIAQGNENNPGGWADGDVNGDTVVDALDIAIIQAAIGGGAIDGDYNDDGSVDQGDLDLVLLNWGDDASATGVPAGWVNMQPTGLIGQTELDGVLLNWGNTAEAGGSAVPEPASFAVLGLTGVALLRRRPR